MSISLTFHGAARSVTGSCIHVQAGTTQLLIDCGVAQDNNSSHHATTVYYHGWFRNV